MKLHFLFGTETGSAEMLCEDIVDEACAGLETQITVMGEVDPADLTEDTIYMIVTSTHGNGDVPANAAPFADALTSQKPDLSHVRFAVFGLGDMVFAETFAHGSKQVMEALLACGATMIGERGIHDASTAEMPEDIAVPWAQDILAQLTADAA